MLSPASPLQRRRGERQQRLLLAGEVHPVRGLQVVQRLDPERVAGAERPAGRAVPDQEGEHAAQLVQHRLAPVVVPGDDDLGVALGGELGAESVDQLLPQLDVVVDLAVEGEQVPARFRAARRVRQRLVAQLDVDDGQALVGEDHVTVGEDHTGLVRTTVVLALQRRRDRVTLGGRGPGVTDEHEHSTHGRHLSTHDHRQAGPLLAAARSADSLGAGCGMIPGPPSEGAHT